MTPEALAVFHRLRTSADELLETCIRDRLSLRATLDHFLPAFKDWLGAKAVMITTQDEHLVNERFSWGEAQPLLDEGPRQGEGCARMPSGDTVLWQVLDLAGTEVGRISVLLPGDRTGEASLLRISLDAVVEELDAVLATVHTAAHKQRLIVSVTELLTNPVFEEGIDLAVALLHEEICVPDFTLLYRDDVEQGRYHYRIYAHGKLSHESDSVPHPALEAALKQDGSALLDPNRQLLRTTIGYGRGVEAVLISGLTRSDWLGKVVCSGGEHGFSTFALDVVQVMCEAISQRLVDFNRERRHLAQFFAPKVISELLRHPHYHEQFLTPRDRIVGVLYADINSFTKLSEQVLEQPEAIARFVDRWSAGAVQLLWDHGGVFDKMVGDCIIGLFGPPFFRDTPEQSALRALKAARAIAEFTSALEKEAPYDKIPTSGVVPGLGVAIGLNLCPMAVGMLGPNQDYTGFSSGMNNTARLQSLAGFRETVAMDTFVEALGKLPDPTLQQSSFGDITETPVKNVKKPLRYRKVKFL